MKAGVFMGLPQAGGIAKARTRAKGAVSHCRWNELRPSLWQTARYRLCILFLLPSRFILLFSHFLLWARGKYMITFQTY